MVMMVAINIHGDGNKTYMFKTTTKRATEMTKRWLNDLVGHHLPRLLHFVPLGAVPAEQPFFHGLAVVGLPPASRLVPHVELFVRGRRLAQPRAKGALWITTTTISVR